MSREEEIEHKMYEELKLNEPYRETLKEALFRGEGLFPSGILTILYDNFENIGAQKKYPFKGFEYLIEFITNDIYKYSLRIDISEEVGYAVFLEQKIKTITEPQTEEKDIKKVLKILNSQFVKDALIKYRNDDRNLTTVLLEIHQKEIERLTNLSEKLGKEAKDLTKKLKQVKKVGKFKRSAHLTDQILKYDYPNRQPSLFDSLQDGSKKEIEKAGVEIKQIVEGIKLSPSETKIIDCLCKLLHENSQNTEPSKDDYYSGNEDFDLIPYGGEQGDKNTPAPKLAFTLYELALEYKGGEYVSGKDIDNVKAILQDLDSKKFLLSYVETTKKKDGGRIERKIEDFRKLISIVKISQTEFNNQDIELSKKEDTIIMLNPIFRRQIDSKFILYPNDINRRTIIAYGSHNLSDIALRLRDYLMRERSSKRYTPEINLDKLYYLLAEKWMKESRKKKVKEYTDRAIETVTALGLLTSHEIVTGASGEPKIIFTINKKWE